MNQGYINRYNLRSVSSYLKLGEQLPSPPCPTTFYAPESYKCGHKERFFKCFEKQVMFKWLNSSYHCPALDRSLNLWKGLMNNLSDVPKLETFVYFTKITADTWLTNNIISVYIALMWILSFLVFVQLSGIFIEQWHKYVLGWCIFTVDDLNKIVNTYDTIGFDQGF